VIALHGFPVDIVVAFVARRSARVAENLLLRDSSSSSAAKSNALGGTDSIGTSWVRWPDASGDCGTPSRS